MSMLPLSTARARVSDAIAASRERGGKVSCQGLGCNGCCRGKVMVRADELTRIMSLLDDAAWVRVRAAAPQIAADPEHAPCPLLDPKTGACSVYAERPLTCRAYIVVTPVDWCYPERSGDRQVGNHLLPFLVLGEILGVADGAQVEVLSTALVAAEKSVSLRSARTTPLSAKGRTP